MSFLPGHICKYQWQCIQVLFFLDSTFDHKNMRCGLVADFLSVGPVLTMLYEMCKSNRTTQDSYSDLQTDAMISLCHHT